MPRLHGVRLVQRFNFFDSFRPEGLQRSPLSLFGCAQLGDAHLTNMVRAGVLSGDSEHWIEHLYARTDLPSTAALELRAAFERWTHYVMATLYVRDQPTTFSRTLFDLLRERPWMPPSVAPTQMSAEEHEGWRQRRQEGAKPVCVPIRQNFAIQVVCSSQPALDDLMNAVGKTGERMPLVWIHLEGLQQSVE